MNWINVNEMYPEKYARVLVKVSPAKGYKRTLCDFIYIARYCDCKKWEEITSRDVLENDYFQECKNHIYPHLNSCYVVTHWQLLPDIETHIKSSVEDIKGLDRPITVWNIS